MFSRGTVPRNQIEPAETDKLPNIQKGLITLFIVRWVIIKSVLSGHSKIDKTKILMTNGSLMKVESIAECSPWSILQYF